MAADEAAVVAIEAYYGTLAHTDDLADAGSVASFMATQSIVKTAGSSDTFAVAQFSDGLTYILDTFEEAAASASSTAVANVRKRIAQTARTRRDVAAPSTTVLLAPSTAYVFSNPTAFLDSTPEQGIAQALQTAGYTTVSEPLSLANLQAVQNASLLYLNSHGYTDGDLQATVPGGPSQGATYAVALSDQYVPRVIPPQPYLGLLFTGGSAGTTGAARTRTAGAARPDGIFPVKGTGFATPNELVLTAAHPIAANGQTQRQLVHLYAATQTFFALQKQITFRQNAFVFFNTCWSDDYSNGGLEDLLATLDARGVGSYLGFTKTADYLASNETANFLFDRWLGEQNSAATSAIQEPPAKESPPERPFSLGDVLTYAQTYAHADGTPEQDACVPENTKEPLPAAGCAELGSAFDPNGDTLLNPETALAPSTAYMYVTEPYSGLSSDSEATLHLTGDFGAVPGSVTMQPGGSGPSQTLAHPAWSASEIDVPIAASGAAAAGIVTVIGANGVSSNGVPLTEWSGTVGISDVQNISEDDGYLGNGSLVYAAQLNVQVRDDVHPFRATIGATPTPQDFAFDDVMQSSTGTFSKAQGSFTSVSGGNTYTFSFAPNTPVTLSPNTAAQDPGPNVFSFPFATTSGCSTGPNGISGLPDCSYIGVSAQDVAQCTEMPASGDLCPGEGVSGPVGAGFTDPIGSPFTFGIDAGYNIVTKPSVSFLDELGGILTGSSGTTTFTFRFGPPVSPPTAATAQ